MGKMKNVYIEMKNRNWKGTPSEFLKLYLKEKENDTYLHKKNK